MRDVSESLLFMSLITCLWLTMTVFGFDELT